MPSISHVSLLSWQGVCLIILAGFVSGSPRVRLLVWSDSESMRAKYYGIAACHNRMMQFQMLLIFKGGALHIDSRTRKGKDQGLGNF